MEVFAQKNLAFAARWRGRQNARNRGETGMIYRRDTRNRSLDDFNEAKPRTGARAGQRQARSARSSALPVLSPAPQLAAAALK